MDAIIGDPPMGVVGMVTRLENVEQTVTAMQEERNAEKAARKGAYFVVAAIGTVAGALGSTISFVSGFWKTP